MISGNRLRPAERIDSAPVKVVRIISVSDWSGDVRQVDCRQVARYVVVVVKTLARRIGDLGDPPLRIPNERNRDVTGTAGDARRAERQKVIVQIFNRAEFA